MKLREGYYCLEHTTASAEIAASEVRILDIAPTLDVFHPYRSLDLSRELDGVRTF